MVRRDIWGGFKQRPSSMKKVYDIEKFYATDDYIVFIEKRVKE